MESVLSCGRSLPLAQLERDAGEVLVVKSKVNGLAHTCVHPRRVLQVPFLLDQLVEQLPFALEQDLADARDEIGQLVHVLLELLVLDADVVLHIETDALSERRSVHPVISEHLCELIEIRLDCLLHFGFQCDELSLSRPQSLALSLEEEDLLRQSVVRLEQLLLTILQCNFGVLDLYCPEIEAFIVFPCFAQLYYELDFLLLHLGNFLV